MVCSMLLAGCSCVCHNPEHESISRASYKPSPQSTDEEDIDFVSRRWRRTPQRGHRSARHDRSTGPSMAGGTCSIPRPYGPPGRAAQAHGRSHSGAVQHYPAEWLDAGRHATFAGAAAYDSAVSRSAGEAAGEDVARETGGHADFGDSTLQS